MTTVQTVSRDQLRSIIDNETQQRDALVADVWLSSFNTPGFMGE